VNSLWIGDVHSLNANKNQFKSFYRPHLHDDWVNTFTLYFIYLGMGEINMMNNTSSEEGDSRLYEVENVIQRKIIKFKVQGYEYQIRLVEIHPDTNYQEAVQTVYRTLQRK